MAEYEAFRDVRTPQRLQPCSNCGRNFNPDTLLRHEKFCSSQKQRKAFDSRKQRTEDLAADLNLVKKTSETKQPAKKGGKKADWRAKHENLIATLKAARGDGPAVAAVVDPGYVECPYCCRNFNEHSAERHIPFCKEQHTRQQIKNTAAKTKLNVRTKYKPPLPGAKKSNPSLATEGGGLKQRTPNRGAQGSSSAGTTKQSPAQQSPGPRRRNNSDQSDQIDQRALRRKASPSPPPQRRNKLGATKTLDSHSSKYQGMESHNTQRASSGSSSDSDVRRVGSGHSGQHNDPSWFKDLKKTDNHSIFPEKSQQKNSASSTGRHSGRTRENPSHDVFNFDEKPIKPKRRNDHDDEDIFGVDGKPTAIGVVRPSSRKTSAVEERVGSGRRKLANFCHECGTKYPVENAKFCGECGVKRMHIEV